MTIEHKELGPQYWRTSCQVCGKLQFASIEDVKCTECETAAALGHALTDQDLLVNICTPDDVDLPSRIFGDDDDDQS